MLDTILEKLLEVAGELVVEGAASVADVALDAVSSVADKATDIAGGAVDFVTDAAKEKAADMVAEAAIGALGAAAGFVSPSNSRNDDKNSQEDLQESALELQMINQLTSFCDAEIGIGHIVLEKTYEDDEVMKTFQALGKIQAEIICNHFRAYRCFMPDREDNTYCSVSINDLTENLDLAFQALKPEIISWVMLEFGAFGAEGLFAYCADVENKIDEAKTIKTQAFFDDDGFISDIGGMLAANLDDDERYSAFHAPLDDEDNIYLDEYCKFSSEFDKQQDIEKEIWSRVLEKANAKIKNLISTGCAFGEQIDIVVLAINNNGLDVKEWTETDRYALEKMMALAKQIVAEIYKPILHDFDKKTQNIQACQKRCKEIVDEALLLYGK
ncbi:MAG: hypothetical protein K2N12_09040 [Helicobacter sp.]|nr:hypothetical protein [Helicobacter sp.]